ncbi:hypothetical protein Airi01_044750 [Actinoallomurus iriomotensis]|uniref:Uncharacterized protein n=1 Tax=Actinoallomurus iriomotensis TaxID=478107 RepID=A0A9W6VL94_9ACTN|nr:hypothetical protein Airi01_044750 [Actinoallomurus iriomotensis]
MVTTRSGLPVRSTRSGSEPDPAQSRTTSTPSGAKRVRLQRPGRQDGVLGVRAAELRDVDDAEDLVARPDTGYPCADLADHTRGIHAEHVGQAERCHFAEPARTEVAVGGREARCPHAHPDVAWSRVWFRYVGDFQHARGTVLGECQRSHGVGHDVAAQARHGLDRSPGMA